MSSMQLLSRHERNLTGLARGIRAAIVLPLLFALSLGVVGQPVMAGFSVFGTFAHLVMVDYSPSKGARLAESATLTILGAVLLTLGTAASINLWLAVAGAISAGCLAQFPTKWPSFVRANIGALRSALLMVFMLAVAGPSSLSELPLQLAGWLLAGLAAQVALQWLWLPIRSIDQATSLDDRSLTLLGSAASGLSMGLAVLTARILSLDHAFWVVLGVAPVLAAARKSAAYALGRQQAGTLLGFFCGVLLVAAIGGHQWGYWIALPCTVFMAAYVSSAVGFMAGQAAFTAFAVVLFCILAPLQRHVGIVRIEDIAVGGAISLLVGFLQSFGLSLRRPAAAVKASVSRIDIA
jgi:fusaric acid resistance family protein